MESSNAKPETSVDEKYRLEKLHSLNILETLPQERFDRLTRMAKRLFVVPIAIVSLVDEQKQWFKSSFGLAVSETNRMVFFCGHTLLGGEPLIIPDTTKDQRFFDNSLVTQAPFIRFYAGCPLKSANGQKLGTLCIIDDKPRHFTDEDIEILKDLVSMIEHEMAAVQLATLDALTDISNRRGFSLLGQHSLELCRRQKIPGVLIVMDLDKFKSINDTYGHAEGDRALIVFSEVVKSTCRDFDVFARVGGDEFAILLTNTNEVNAMHVITRMKQALKLYNQQSETDYKIDFSFGTVEFDPKKHDSIDDLLAQGDRSMYADKKLKEGRNR